jgi:hypothetical protein
LNYATIFAGGQAFLGFDSHLFQALLESVFNGLLEPIKNILVNLLGICSTSDSNQLFRRFPEIEVWRMF